MFVRFTIAMLAMSSVAHAGGKKPLLEGKYELVQLAPPKGDPIDFGKLLTTGAAVWSRMVWSFEDSKLVISNETLSLEKGVYSACQASLSIELAWTAKGFSIPTKLEGGGAFTSFKTLTANDSDSQTQRCSVSIVPTTFEVVDAKTPKLKSKDGVFTFARTADVEKVDWKLHVKH